MDWLYLSPHLDDAALSCGGLIWEQAQTGESVAIWTICAGDPPPGPLSDYASTLHARWGTGREAMSQRRAEDRRACRQLGTAFRHFPIPDCIYRRSPLDGKPFYNSDEDIFGRLHPLETPLVRELSRALASSLPSGVNLVCPLTLGGHVDHQLVRRAAMDLKRPLWYYADYPYVLEKGAELVEATNGLQAVDFPVSVQGLQAWVQAVADHASQISTFWKGFEALQDDLHAYWQPAEGIRLWRNIPEK